MQIPGNMWAEVWQSAKPVPVRRQKRLFDDTKEAEKVLHFLSALRPADVAMRLMPMLIHAAIVKLLEQGMFFSFSPSSALISWSSTQVLVVHWYTFCAGGNPNVHFSFSTCMAVVGFEPLTS